MSGCKYVAIGFGLTLLTGVWAPFGFLGIGLMFIGWHKLIPVLARFVKEWEGLDD